MFSSVIVLRWYPAIDVIVSPSLLMNMTSSGSLTRSAWFGCEITRSAAVDIAFAATVKPLMISWSSCSSTPCAPLARRATTCLKASHAAHRNSSLACGS